MKTLNFLLVIWVYVQGTLLSAANLELFDLSISGHDVQAQTIQVHVSVRWSFAWNHDRNHDAVWVFLKFRTGSPLREIREVGSNGLLCTAASTAGLRVGMPLSLVSGTGAISPGTYITAITSATQFTVSALPPVPLQDAVLSARHHWEHVYLGASGHASGTGTPVDITPAWQDPLLPHHAEQNPVMGVWIKLSAAGEGTCQVQQLSLRWPYGVQGLNMADFLEIKAFGIEMVYVPEGSFSLGDGSGDQLAGIFHDAADVQLPFRVVGESAITLGGTAAGHLSSGPGNGLNLDYPDDFSAAQERILPAAFPKGYRAFYAMKYPVSQQQYTDFLNTLSRNEQEERTQSLTALYVMSATATPVHRNGISRADLPLPDMPVQFYCDLNGNGRADDPDDGGTLACNYTHWADLLHYAAWSGLRPMTELEYEKAVRGPDLPKLLELAWGSEIMASASGLQMAGTAQESLSPMGANVSFQQVLAGPHRVGIAARPYGNRRASAASYWGIADMSTNVFERTISVGSAAARQFTGTHGDGRYNHIPGWPEPSGLGLGWRGGAWSSPPLTVSSRGEVNVPSVTRDMASGIRLVRSISCASPNVAPDDIMGERNHPAGTLAWFSSSGGNNYQWIVPHGWKLIQREPDGSAAIISGALDQHGELRVALKNACGAGPETILTVYAVE